MDCDLEDSFTASGCCGWCSFYVVGVHVVVVGVGVHVVVVGVHVVVVGVNVQ